MADHTNGRLRNEHEMRGAFLSPSSKPYSGDEVFIIPLGLLGLLALLATMMILFQP
jgi:hypothetical protein